MIYEFLQTVLTKQTVSVILKMMTFVIITLPVETFYGNEQTHRIFNLVLFRLVTSKINFIIRNFKNIIVNTLSNNLSTTGSYFGCFMYAGGVSKNKNIRVKH
jgi:hypothetical protein